jgi:hypothetical protein
MSGGTRCTNSRISGMWFEPIQTTKAMPVSQITACQNASGPGCPPLWNRHDQCWTARIGDTTIW